MHHWQIVDLLKQIKRALQYDLRTAESGTTVRYLLTLYEHHTDVLIHFVIEMDRKSFFSALKDLEFNEESMNECFPGIKSKVRRDRCVDNLRSAMHEMKKKPET